MGLLLVGACDRRSEPPQQRGRSAIELLPGSPSAATPQPETSARELQPTVLLSLPTAAYGASVSVDEDAVYVLTSSTVYRLAEGQPAQAIPLELGFGAAVTRHSFVFWSKGAVWQFPKAGGSARRIGALRLQPQYFVAADDTFAWLDRTSDGQFKIQSFENNQPRTLYSTSIEVTAATLLAGAVYFVERTSDKSFRIGRAPLSGSAVTFGAPRVGRAPAMLGTFRDIFYYDGNTREVRRISADLARDELYVEDFICSPLLAGERLLCANVEGLFELPGKSQRPRRLTPNGANLITAMGAHGNRLAWISDTGAERLSVSFATITR